MPRRTRAQKDARKAKEDALKAEEDALKASETSTTTTTTTTAASNCGSCGTSSHLGSAGGEARVLTAGENKQENATEITASEVVQDKRPEKRMAEIDKERSDGGERGPGEDKHEKMTGINGSEAMLDKGAGKRMAEIEKKRSDGGERGLGENKHEKMTGINGSEAMPDKGAGKRMAEIEKKRADGGERGLGENKHEKMTDIDGSEAMRDKGAGKRMAEIEKKRSDGGERGPSRKGGEEEAVSLRPSQFDSRQKQRDEGSSFAGSKGFRQDNNGRNSSVQQSYEAENSRKGSNQGYYQNRGRGRGGDDGGDSRRIDALGRALSTILRHRALQLGLKVRSDGYIVVKDLLSLSTKTQTGQPLHSYSIDDLKEAVKRDDKQRFGLLEENGILLIRANQGHSIRTIKSEELLKPILSPKEVPVCIHGTYMVYLESIKKEGLKRMRRNHVHFATGQFNEDGVISGMRGDCQVLIHMDVSKALNDGMKLYRSENDVILAEGFDGVVPPKYFAKIELVGKKGNKNV